MAEYPRALRNIDIGCASVADNHFNRCKTPIKLWEFTLGGAVIGGLTNPVRRRVAPMAGCADRRDRRRVGVCAGPSDYETRELRKNLWRAQRRRIADAPQPRAHRARVAESLGSTIIDTFKPAQAGAGGMKDYRCPNCGKVLFKAEGNGLVQILCRRCGNTIRSVTVATESRNGANYAQVGVGIRRGPSSPYRP